MFHDLEARHQAILEESAAAGDFDEAEEDAAWEALQRPTPRTEQAQVSFDIAPDAWRLFKRNFEKFEKTCKRYGQTLSIVSTTNVLVLNRWTNTFDKPVIRVVVSVPPIAGEKGRVLGRFEQTEDKKGHYIHVTDEVYRPTIEALKDRADECDHCNTARDRRQTFVCQTDDGIKLIGRSCLRDFLGLDPAAALNVWGGLEKFESEEWETRAGAGFIKVEEIVHVAYRVARKLGGYDKSNSQRHASLLLFGNRETADFQRRQNEETLKSYVGFEPAFDAEAFAAYILGLTKGNDFTTNLTTALGQEYVSVNRIGLLVAGVGLSVGNVLRHENDAKAAASRPAAKLLDHAIGARVDFVAEVTRTFIYDGGQFGPTNIISLCADDGARCVHFSSGAFKPAVGERYLVRGTVKKHGKNKQGEPETTLSRATYKPATLL